MMTETRKWAEERLLLQHLPAQAFKFVGLDTDDPVLVLAAQTNAKNSYVVVIKLAEYPECQPDAYINETLLSKAGVPLCIPSASMHTLDGSGDLKTHICYAGWNPQSSLYKIYLKCKLWLECYELHLKTGNDIDFYLNHQP